MYAIVRAGGHQEKVSVGDEVTVDRLEGEPGATVTFPAVLLVDGDTVTHDREVLDATSVTGEIIDHIKGEKIIVGKYKNKTGYRRKQGHRQALTRVKVTEIRAGK